jgi:hypothetical protein
LALKDIRNIPISTFPDALALLPRWLTIFPDHHSEKRYIAHFRRKKEPNTTVGSEGVFGSHENMALLKECIVVSVIQARGIQQNIHTPV